MTGENGILFLFGPVAVTIDLSWIIPTTHFSSVLCIYESGV